MSHLWNGAGACGCDRSADPYRIYLSHASGDRAISAGRVPNLRNGIGSTHGDGGGSQSGTGGYDTPVLAERGSRFTHSRVDDFRHAARPSTAATCFRKSPGLVSVPAGDAGG